MDKNNLKICVVGLGYVGLPLAVLFGKSGQKVVGFDINEKKIEELNQNIDSMNEVSSEDIKNCNVKFTTDPKSISECNFIIVSVPTPIDSNNTPDLKFIKSSSKVVGENITKGSIVVFESTVYPGVTEEICVPIIEQESGLKYNEDWFIGYSPERVNPGDKEHTIDKIIKIVSGSNNETTDNVADVYSIICKAGVHKAESIKVAEAAKVIENIQRDLNIALMNELSIIFNKMGIDTKEVLKAAGTKWNFHKYYPGLVGGHCIGVDPYYLTFKAEELGYDPKVILAGRRINDDMHKEVANRIIKAMEKEGKELQNSNILILGLTFKENITDFRNSRAKQLINVLKEQGCNVVACEPFLTEEVVTNEFGVKKVSFEDVKKESIDCIILVTSHNEFKNITLDDLKNKSKEKPVIMNIKSFFDKQEAINKGFNYNSL